VTHSAHIRGGRGALGGDRGYSSLPPVACLPRKSAHEMTKKEKTNKLERRSKENAFVMTSKRKQLKKAFPIATTTTNSVCRPFCGSAGGGFPRHFLGVVGVTEHLNLRSDLWPVPLTPAPHRIASPNCNTHRNAADIEKRLFMCTQPSTYISVWNFIYMQVSLCIRKGGSFLARAKLIDRLILSYTNFKNVSFEI